MRKDWKNERDAFLEKKHEKQVYGKQVNFNYVLLITLGLSLFILVVFS